MNKFTKTVVVMIAVLASSLAAFSQTADNAVTLVVSGDGATKDEAIKQALRSAIEQTFGTFFSANTEVLNDEIIQDEIVTVSTGNITDYKEINTLKNEDNTYSTIVEATVSIGKLANFAKSKGMSVELAAGMFAMNMKMRELNRRNEHKAVSDLYKKISKMTSEYKMFDYKLILSEPYLAYSNSDKYYAVEATIEITPNQNLANFRNTILSTLKALSLSDEEIEEYERARLYYGGFAIKDYFTDKDFFEHVDDHDYRCGHYSDNEPYKRVYIALRGNYDMCPFSRLLLKNQMQFAIQDNLNNRFSIVRTVREGELEWNDKWRGCEIVSLNLGKNDNEKNVNEYFAMVDSRTSKLMRRVSAACYKMVIEDRGYYDDAFDVISTLSRKEEPLKCKFELVYPSSDFEKLEKIELIFSDPLYVESSNMTPR